MSTSFRIAFPACRPRRWNGALGRAPALLVLLLLGASCAAGASAPGEAITASAPVASVGAVCTLEQVGQTFLCDLEFAAAGDCQAAVSDSVRREFLQRMTSISLQLLYLDGERGATPPFRYNQIDQVLSDITVQSCSSSGAGSCRCRLAYQDSELLQIFYDSAGCRRSSRFMRHPLYFEGEGCR